jgi:pimeloyl-ACP methyl ester carboxylesterase
MTRAMARSIKAPAPAERVHAGMNYPYAILWTGSHGSYREAHALELACPLLFIYGRAKPFMFHSPTWAARLARRPGCDVVPLDTGHWAMKDNPAAVNQAILRWLR